MRSASSITTTPTLRRSSLLCSAKSSGRPGCRSPRARPPAMRAPAWRSPGRRGSGRWEVEVLAEQARVVFDLVAQFAGRPRSARCNRPRCAAPGTSGICWSEGQGLACAGLRLDRDVGADGLYAKVCSCTGAKRASAKFANSLQELRIKFVESTRLSGRWVRGPLRRAARQNVNFQQYTQGLPKCVAARRRRSRRRGCSTRRSWTRAATGHGQAVPRISRSWTAQSWSRASRSHRHRCYSAGRDAAGNDSTDLRVAVPEGEQVTDRTKAGPGPQTGRPPGQSRGDPPGPRCPVTIWRAVVCVKKREPPGRAGRRSNSATLRFPRWLPRHATWFVKASRA